MDCNDNYNTETWDWQAENYDLQTNVPNGLWNNVNENEDDLSYVFNETTPIKSLGDLAYQVTGHENLNKEVESYRESVSQAKRRRMLQFNDEDLDVDIMPLRDEDFSSIYLKSKDKEESLDEAFSDMTQWVSGFADDMSVSGSGYVGLDQSSEGWLADCLINDTEMHSSPDDMNISGTSDAPIELTESNNSQPENGRNPVREHPTPGRSIIFKGKKSLINTPTKMAASVVLPFAFVKPCGMQGAVTLKDINQKILTPPPSKPKKTYEDPPISYPKSAFSGKPVIGKTKIRTEGGKGSITIMRTKG